MPGSMSAVAQRLQEALTEVPINLSALATAARVPRSTGYHLLDGTQATISYTIAKGIARVLDVRTEWLLTGEGPKGPYESGSGGDAQPPATQPPSQPPLDQPDPLVSLAESIRAAAAAGQWEVVRELSSAMRAAAEAKSAVNESGTRQRSARWTEQR